MRDEPLLNNNIITWIDKKVIGKPCPACGINRPDSWETVVDSRRITVLAGCRYCHSKFSEEIWDRYKEVSSNESEKIVEIPESEECDKSKATNLLIFRSMIFKENSERDSELYKKILNQIRNGVVILPGSVEFIGAYKYDPAEDTTVLFVDGKPYMEGLKE